MRHVLSGYNNVYLHVIAGFSNVCLCEVLSSICHCIRCLQLHAATAWPRRLHTNIEFKNHWK